jgi:NADH-quinone oxidoreductase subunit J
MQILVYTGAVMVLFVFVVMLLNSDEVSLDTSKNNNFFSLATLLLAGAMFFLTVWSIKNGKMAVPKDTHTALKVLEMGGNTRVISRAMFSEYILPFELTSILLLTGIVGAITMAKRKHKKQIK